jgi:hypothetical protein
MKTVTAAIATILLIWPARPENAAQHVRMYPWRKRNQVDSHGGKLYNTNISHQIFTLDLVAAEETAAVTECKLQRGTAPETVPLFEL